MSTVDVSWMRGSSPLKGALLGLLLQHPGHGYDLANRLSRRLGPAWQIEAKRLYPMLQQLERAGLVSSEAIACNGPTRRRLVYSPTERAQSALTDWMATGVSTEPFRAELQAKLAVARGEDVPRLLAGLDRYEQECSTLLEASSEDLPRPRSLCALAIFLTRTAALTRLRAELEWVGLARQAIAELAATQAAARAAPPRGAARMAGDNKNPTQLGGGESRALGALPHAARAARAAR